MFPISLISFVYNYASLLQQWHLPASYNAAKEYGLGCRAFEEISNQGHCGACSAFAMASAYGMRSCKNGGNDLPSAYRIFDCGKGDCEAGMNIYELVSIMRTGVTDLAQTPQVYGLGCPSSGPLKISNLFPILLSPLIKREILANGPVLAVVSVSEEYYKYYDYNSVYDDTSLLANHMVVVLGWGAATDTEPEHWIIQNAWSTDWGEGGRGKHSMSFFTVMYAIYN
jgi:Papain family cysteine protease